MIVTEEQYQNCLNVPISLPETIIGPHDSIVVASVKVELGQRLRFRWANFEFLREDPVLAAPGFVNSSLGRAYMGLYSGNRLHIPAGMPLALLRAESYGVRSTNPFAYKDFSSPGIYEVLVVNNMTNANIHVVVSGCLQLFLK